MGHEPVVIPEKIYFKIGEVCELVGVQAHVLRYWETEFPMLSPQKNKSGQRSYRRRDVEMALRIKMLLYNEMFTIAGAKKKLQSELRSNNKPKFAPETTVPPAEKKVRNVEAPTLFDNVYEPEVSPEVQSSSVSDTGNSQKRLAGNKSDVIKTIAGHLLELRDMLNSSKPASLPQPKN
jgi:DNA-binding transcriptional MerR regulator